MSFKKINVAGTAVGMKGVYMTITGTGMIAVTIGTKEPMEKRVFDVYEDEETKQIKLQENENGDLKLRKSNKVENGRYLVNRRQFVAYLMETYGIIPTSRVIGMKVEDGYIFDMNTAVQVKQVKQ